MTSLQIVWTNYIVISTIEIAKCCFQTRQLVPLQQQLIWNVSSRRCAQTSYLKGPLSLTKIKVKSTSTLRILLLYVNQSLKSLNQTVCHLDTVDQR